MQQCIDYFGEDLETKSCLKNVVSLQIGLLARIAKTNSVSGKYLFFQIVFELILLFTLS